MSKSQFRRELFKERKEGDPMDGCQQASILFWILAIAVILKEVLF